MIRTSYKTQRGSAHFKMAGHGFEPTNAGGTLKTQKIA